MLIFWWKKYDGDWLATFISMIGTIFVTFVALGVIGLLLSLLGDHTAFIILSIVIGIVVFFALKYLLNMLTDKIDAKTTEMQVKKMASKPDRLMAKVDQEVNQKKLYKMIKKEFGRDILVPVIQKLTDQSLIDKLISHYNAQYIMAAEGGRDYYAGLITELINQIPDENEREKRLTYFREKIVH